MDCEYKLPSPHYLKNAFHNDLLISNLNTYAEWYEEIMLIAKETYFRQTLSVKKKKSSATTVKIADLRTHCLKTLFYTRLIICLSLRFGVVFHPRVCVARVPSVQLILYSV